MDEMAQEQGKLVLRFPPYHCELNPIEFIWSQMKGYVARNNKTFTLKEVTQLLHDGVQRITGEAWANCVRHVIETEEPRFWRVDDIMEEIAPVAINVGHEDSLSSDTD